MNNDNPYASLIADLEGKSFWFYRYLASISRHNILVFKPHIERNLTPADILSVRDKLFAWFDDIPEIYLYADRIAMSRLDDRFLEKEHIVLAFTPAGYGDVYRMERPKAPLKKKLKITFTFPTGKLTWSNVEDLVIYPDGDINTKTYASGMHKVSSTGRTEYSNCYNKPTSIWIEQEK